MAGEINTGNRKPRHLRRTPALRYINSSSVITLALCSAIGYFIYTRPNLKRIEQDFFSNEEIAAEHREREQRKFYLSNQLVGQKTTAEIRATLRHKQKYETELVNQMQNERNPNTKLTNNMDSQNEPTKPKRLKFSRLCLSQNRNAALVRSSTQVSSSQVSRFFTHSKVIDETHRNTEPMTQNRDGNDESNDCLNATSVVVAAAVAVTEGIAINCDNDIEPLYNADNKLNEKQSHEKKRKHRSDKRNDSKSTIKSFFSNEINDSLSDFELPNKIVKRVPKVKPAKVVKASRSRPKQPDIRKALNKVDASCNDYSHLPEDAQLELVLALSKAESINGITGEGTTSSKLIDLDAFAFNAINSKSSNKGDVFNFFNINRKAKTRFKWNSKCTQLTRRNDDTQKSKVRNKIDEILLNNIVVESSQADRLKSSEGIDLIDYTPHDIYSRHLQRICVSERILFELNNCDKNTKSNLRSYYTNNLVDMSELEANALLKDWSQIPGRDTIYDTIDGIQKAATEIIGTDAMTVISSSPEYDIQTESNKDDADNDQIHEITSPSVEQQMDSAGCSRTIQSNQFLSLDVESDSTTQSLDDENRTIVMDTNDIKLKIDAINSTIRSSQQFCDNFKLSEFTCQATTTARAQSPDLFDDDDEACVEYNGFINNEIQESDRKIPVIAADEDYDATTCSNTMERAPDDVILISSSEANTDECNTNPVSSEDFQSESQHLHTQDNLNSAKIEDIETIELVDSDSEGMLKEHIALPKIHLSKVNRKSGDITSPPLPSLSPSPFVLPDMKLLDEEFNNLMQSADSALQVQSNHSARSNETSSEFKKLSFTERLELFEKDMSNGFTADFPVDLYGQSQQQLSQESINLSDDEINYSMCKGANQSAAIKHNDDDCDNEQSPIELDWPDSNANQMVSEQKLVNRSVCNIFEKTFEQYGSPVAVKNKKISGAKTLRKFQSATVLSARYGHELPSTSRSSNNRTPLTPNKKQSQFESPHKTNNYSPISQPQIEETRMDLSNDEYYIRIGSISPKPNFEQMDAWTLEMEQRKYGLKPSLSRRQAIICLEYIYNRTHPFMESGVDLCNSPKKKNNQCSSSSDAGSSGGIGNHSGTVNEPIRAGENDNDASSKDPKINFNVGFAAQNLVNEKFKRQEVNKVFLPSVPRAKRPWCLEPLHIAWHNLITANADLRKAVLLYEPINLVELKKFFKTIDMTFDNRDLIAFLDLHCITFRMIKASRE